MNYDERAIWNAFAPIYDRFVKDSGDLNHRLIVNPQMFTLLGDVEGSWVLDACCGQGYFSRLLAEKGATVVAVDFAEEMIKLANRRKPADLVNLEYRCQAIEQQVEEWRRSFDIVVFNMAVMNVTNVESALAVVSQYLKDGGVLVLSMLHPCFVHDESGRSMGHHLLSDSSDQAVYRIGDYATAKTVQTKWGDMEMTIPHHHRTLEYYFEQLCSNGLAVTDIREPVATREYEDAYTENEPVWHADRAIPYYLIIKAKKFNVGR